MPQKKISDLTAGSQMNTTDLFEVELADGSSRKLTGQQIAAYVNAILTVGASSNMNTFAEVEAALATKSPILADPTVAPYLVDEFLFGSGEAGEVGDLGWNFTGGSCSVIVPEAGHPGVTARFTGTTANARDSMYTGTSGAVLPIRFDQFDRLTWIIKPATADADFKLRFGLSSDFTSETPAAGVYFERLASETSWYGVTRSASAEGRTAALAAFSADWVRLDLRRVDVDTVAFSVNGGAEVELSTNVPAASESLAVGNHIVPTTTTSRQVRMDFFSLRLLAQTR